MSRRPLHRSLWTLALIVATLTVSAATLWRMCRHSPDIPFLPKHAGAEWIDYPTPVDLWPRKRVPLPSTFERSFAIDAVPSNAPLIMRAFEQAEVAINGEPVALPKRADSNWKEPYEFDVGRYLRAGNNEIIVTVTRDSGRPALWLLLRIGDKRLKSDSSWDVTYAGATKCSAHPARRYLGSGPLRLADEYLGLGDEDAEREANSAPQTQTPPSDLLERTFPSLVARLPTICGFAVLALCVVGAYFYWLPGRTSDEQTAAGLTVNEALLMCVIAAVVWTALGWNNHRSLFTSSGPDAGLHLDYVEYILTNHALPLPGDGKQMHQPPLYYLTAAGLLGIFGLNAFDDGGIALVRALTFFCGIVHVFLVFGSIRLIFPDNAHRQVVGLLIAAFLPVHLFLFHYPTNEAMSAMWSSAAVYVTLRILRYDDRSFRWHLLLGVCLGAAMLSKITALVLLGVIPFVLAGKLLADRIYRPTVWLKTLAMMLLACTLVCGWHYARIAREFDNPLVRYADLEGGGAETWKDPGSHTSADFWRFGQVLVSPYFAGFYSFGDALYSTMWGDGRCGGSGRLILRVPWNYDLMAVGYLLALLPTALITIGWVAAVVGLIRRPSAIWMLLLGLFYSMAFALVIENLRHPYLIVAKAWYALPVIVPICAFGAWGFDVVTRRNRSLRFILYTSMVLWAINAYASFWIVPSSSFTRATWGMRYIVPKPKKGSTKYNMAIQYLTRAVQQDPDDAYAHYGLGRAYFGTEEYDLAIEQFQKVLELDPNDPYAHEGLAEIYGGRHQFEPALRHLKQATMAYPDFVEARFLEGRMYQASGLRDKAIDVYRELLRIKPDAGYQHLLIGSVYEELGDRQAAYQHYQWATDLSRIPRAHLRLARMLHEDDRTREAITHYRQALQEGGTLDEAADGLAWILATCLDAELRDGDEALKLSSELAERHKNNPAYVRTLAAALAETRDFSAARDAAANARKLAEEHGNDELAREIDEQVRFYRANLPYREQ